MFNRYHILTGLLLLWHFRDEINSSNFKSYQCLEWRELCLYFLFCKIALLLFDMYCHFPCAFSFRCILPLFIQRHHSLVSPQSCVDILKQFIK